MKICTYRNVGKFALVSAIKAEDLEVVKKYRPDELKLKDKDGNDTFAVGYNPGHNSLCKNGVTFGGKTEDGFAMLTGDIPATVKAEDVGEYIADYVGPAVTGLNTIEAKIPTVVSAIKAERGALIDSISNF